MIVPVLIRHAQALGLHRVHRNSSPLSQEQYDLHIRLWWYCEYIDISVCYKTGNSCLVSSNDVTTFRQLDAEFDSLSGPLTVKEHIINSHTIEHVRDKQFYQFYSSYFLISLNRIKRRSYESIFSAKAQMENQSEEHFHRVIDNVCKELDELCRLADPGLRPKLPYQDFKDDHRLNPALQNGSKTNNLDFTMMLFRIDYLAHYLIIHRASMASKEKDVKRYNLHLSRSVDCARAIVHIINGLNTADKRSVPKGTVIYFALVGFMTLLANTVLHPNEANAMDDFKILQECTTGFFCSDGVFKNVNSHFNVYRFEQKACFCDLIVRIMMKLLLRVMSSQSKRDLGTELSLSKYVGILEEYYPQLFASEDDKQNPNSRTDNKRLEPTLANLINSEDEGRPGKSFFLEALLDPRKPEEFFTSSVSGLPNFFHDL
ncbi:hypothetical protein CANTEDRAFT_114606 [Yamadazyma tenuis ATCC 10573]|uniref:Xylanolytic transcriptional activator regulatory domain-containing protein n=2 Tax=Candida tenuis TaxID=2315449 RepID=G3B5V2_CANTC|nr:uncharacterized protein CANTEDRAFT_114606 [Yamadazyma tenuis ATCC 10573]EGV63312.1 hypothetical protein CANTEDRAFT_114606 [Yamadazyma tenuis ATCC 10573]